MDFHAHAVAEAVGEIGAEARVLDDLAGGAVDFGAGAPRSGGGDACLLGGQDGFVDSALLVGHGADGNGAGHVGAVATVDAAKVHGHQLPLFHHLPAGDAVGQAPVGTGDHDGVKAHVLGTVMQHEILETRCNLLFRDAGANFLQDVPEGPLGNALGGGHGLQFFAVFHLAQFREHVAGGDEGAVELFPVEIIVLNGHVSVLKAHFLNVPGFDDLVDESGVAPAPGDLRNGGVLHMALRGFGVAGVGEVVIAASGHKGYAVGPGGVEAAGVEAVGFVCQQHGVKAMGGKGGGDFGKVIHGGAPFVGEFLGADGDIRPHVGYGWNAGDDVLIVPRPYACFSSAACTKP